MKSLPKAVQGTGPDIDPLDETESFIQAPTTQRDLFARAAANFDSKIWAEFSELYDSAICHHCARSGLSPTESKDVVREVFEKLATRLGRRPFNWKSTTFRGWLNQVTNGLIFEHHQSQRHQQLPPQLVASIREWLLPAMAPESETHEREQLESHLWSTCLARVRHEAKPSHWQIFEKSVIEGLPARDVAQLFGTTQINVAVVRHRLVARFREAWKNLLSGPLTDVPE